MTAVLLGQILGWVATILFTLMYVPQMMKTYKTKTVDSVSLPMFLLGLVANVVALCYAILIHQYPLVIKYVAALLAILLYIAIYFWARGKNRGV